MWREGWRVLNSGGTSGDRNLALARLGMLPFLWLGIWAVFRIAWVYFGSMTALFATAFFTLLPPILAHAGLATTDMALTAGVGFAIYSLLRWAESPTAWRSVRLGVALAVAVLSKLSALVFLPATVTFLCALHFAVSRRFRWNVRPYLRPAVIAFVLGFACLWGTYRFSFDRYPAPEFFAGIQAVRAHNQQGHQSFLLGQISQFGFWYYYPVVLSVKTPLALLFLFLAGSVIGWRRRHEGGGRYLQPAVFAVAMLTVCAFSSINIGVRHILPIYGALCIGAAIAADALWVSKSRAARYGLAGLLVWMITSSLASHPDYLAYFNEVAGDRPERIVVDSDLDWGQDWKRLANRLRAAGATEVAVDPVLVNDPQVLHGLPKLIPLDPDAPRPGWNVVDLSVLKLRLWMFHDAPRQHPWAERIPPTERIGKTLLLWYVPKPPEARP